MYFKTGALTIQHGVSSDVIRMRDDVICKQKVFNININIINTIIEYNCMQRLK